MLQQYEWFLGLRQAFVDGSLAVPESICEGTGCSGWRLYSVTTHKGVVSLEVKIREVTKVVRLER